MRISIDLAGLAAIAPEFMDIEGKHFPLKLTLQEILADGKLDQGDILRLGARWMSAPKVQPALPPASPPVLVPTPTPTPGPVLVPGPHPADPFPPFVPTTRELWPSSLSLDVAKIILPDDSEPTFSLKEHDDHYEIVLGPDSPTTNLPIRSRIVFSVGYLDAAGNGIDFDRDNTPHLEHTAAWIVESISGEGRVRIGPGKNAEMVTQGEHVANIREAEYTRTRGMDPVVKFPAEANDLILRVNVGVTTPTGFLDHKPVHTPKIS